MALESTNNWEIKNKMIHSYSSAGENAHQVTLDLYNGDEFRASVEYIIDADETEENADIYMWDRINEAKTKWLEEQV
jgi:hypothetical protein